MFNVRRPEKCRTTAAKQAAMQLTAARKNTDGRTDQ